MEKLEYSGSRGKTTRNAGLKAGNVAATSGSVRSETLSSPEDSQLQDSSTDNNLVELDFQMLGKMGFLTPDAQNMTLSEQLRRIKMPILANAFGSSKLEIERSNLVMVTSAIQSEGKSFTSFNLAMSIAKEFNHTVLYVDADITQRMMDNLLALGDRAGLVDLLLDDGRDMSSLLLKTNVPRLILLPSGRTYDRVTELWSSRRMSDLMSELSKRYSDRLIIFDAPPLLQDSSASMLAQLVGQIIFVVEAEKTPRHLVEEAISTLDGPQYIGLVLNKSNQRESSDYGYYYGKGQ